MDADRRWPWRAAVADLLERTRLAKPDELPDHVNAAVARLGVQITIYLVDYEQRILQPVPLAGKPAAKALALDTTLAGRVFMGAAPLQAAGRLWIRLLDGSERLGVLEVLGPDELLERAEFRGQCDLFGALVGHLIVLKEAYGDALVRIRRTRRMSEASELLWRLVPPLTFACEAFVISAIFEPAYAVGGDGFDYAINGNLAYLAILDTLGHGLPAGLGTAVVLSAIRAARRADDGLGARARAADAALAEQFTDLRFTTAVLAELDLGSGSVRYVNAGHPPPLVIRGHRVVRRLDGGRRMPLGLDDADIEIAVEQLEPGDRLLCYTDGVVEARDAAGQEFGEQRLVDLAEQHATANLSAPEMLRRLSHAVLRHYDGPPADDATLLVLEWSRAAAAKVLP